MAVYHLKASFGSRASGQSAAAKSDYIERDGRYERDRDELEHRESGHMPAWAEDAPRAYWQAADEYERANGRLYSEIQFAIPRELDAGGRRALAGAFAERVCAGERLPYTLAIHCGGSAGENPHAHLMFSERGNDGIARPAEQWFKRHNAKAPEQGGARKSRAAKAGDWLATTRQAWEQTANRALEQAGREARIDHRSLAERRDAAARDGDLDRAAELSREPNIHLGPSRHRASDGVAAREKRRQVARMEREIAAVGARLQETYDRVRRAVDARVQHAGRAIRAGAERAVRAGRELGQAGAAVGRAVRTGADAAWRSGRELGSARATVSRSIRTRAESAHRVGEYARGATTTNGRTCHDLDHRIRRAVEERQQNDRRLQQCYERVGNTYSMIHPEAEQKRKDGDRPDRVEGLIESRIQNRMRSRDIEL